MVVVDEFALMVHPTWVLTLVSKRGPKTLKDAPAFAQVPPSSLAGSCLWVTPSRLEVTSDHPRMHRQPTSYGPASLCNKEVVTTIQGRTIEEEEQTQLPGEHSCWFLFIPLVQDTHKHSRNVRPRATHSSEKIVMPKLMKQICEVHRQLGCV